MPIGVYIRTEQARKNIGLASLGRKHSEETKRKISEHSPKIWLGKKFSLETKNKISIHHRKYQTEETKEKIRLNHRRHQTEETCKKISIAHKGKHLNIGIQTRFKKGHIMTLEVRKKISDAFSGKRHWNWKGGIPKTYYTRKRKFYEKEIGLLTIDTLQQVYEDNIKRYGTLTCYLCLKPIEFKKDTLEHKIPLSRGGTNARDNLNIAHRSCNCKKGKKTEEEYRLLIQEKSK